MKEYTVYMTQRELDALWVIGGAVGGGGFIRDLINSFYHDMNMYVSQDVLDTHSSYFVTGSLYSYHDRMNL